MQSFIVIGAGILGASTAYHLARSGATVTLIDRNDIGKATEAAAGIVCPWLTQRRNKSWYRLVKNGARYYPKLINMLEADREIETGYRRVGAISLHTDEDKLDKMEERAYERRKDAPEIGEITRLSAAETKTLFPPLSENYGAVHISGAARVNGGSLCQALIRAAQKHGATILQGDASLIANGNQIIGVKYESGVVEAENVIVTAGAWAGDLLKPLQLKFHVMPQKAQILHLEMPSTETNEWPVVIPPNNQYLLAFDHGRIVIGATHEDEMGFDHRVTAVGVHEILDKALMIAPGLKQATILETRVGFRPFTPGFLPMFGPVPDFQGMFVANGLGASGLTSGPYLGAELARLALGKPTELDLSNYDIAQAIEKI